MCIEFAPVGRPTRKGDAPPLLATHARRSGLGTMNGKLVAFAFVVLGHSASYAFNLGPQDLSGENVFEQQFIEDYERANVQLVEEGSLRAMLDLVQKYKRPLEQAELELTIGLAYNQRTGLIDPAKAVEHLSNAFRFDLPERTSVDILMWRGGSYEQLKQPRKALEDYLRGLVACSYYALSREWPEIEKPPQPIYINSSDPENEIRTRDYNAYRRKTDFIQHLLMRKYFFIDSIRRVQQASRMDQETILETLERLTPDAHVIETVENFLGEENNRPWP